MHAFGLAFLQCIYSLLGKLARLLCRSKPASDAEAGKIDT